MLLARDSIVGIIIRSSISLPKSLFTRSVMHHHNELNVTKALVTGSCIAVRVKRLAGNEIEQGIGIPTIESRASNIPTRQRELYTGLLESLTSWFIR